MMDKVVSGRTCFWIDQITDHADVRDEEEQWEPPPGVIQSQEKVERQSDERKLFQPYQCLHLHPYALRGKKV
jgi:hypothetical protein